ncbi:putative phage replisome organizer [Paenibacillus sp. V4I3]|uniref:phage replisome organizer N-terminal domain-containing protein n=1 Tax=Paenibacillus sp. V4I3 TaxID=3042305 RepID=UPI0027883EE7|nr:phage replisome organizer N-terminal domain-containing protein [Paenibacillus sp. V4I3]MDQ0873773.1 putative phage replisome organizer [Paenibacillus sp. V4I3]
MADVRWIKIYTDMISNKKIKRIRKLPEGNNIVLIWVFLLAQAGECNKSGALYLTDTISFRPEDLAIEFDFEVSVINLALITLERFSMIEVFDEIIYIKNWDEYQNIEGMDKIREQTRLRNIKYREKRKQLLLSDVSVTSHDETELELDLEIDLEKESLLSAAAEIACTKEDEPINYYNAHKKAFGFYLNPRQNEILGAYIDQDGMQEAVIIRSIERAAEKMRGPYRFGLIETIVKGYLSAGAKTIEIALALDEEFDKGGMENAQGNKGHVRYEQNTGIGSGNQRREEGASAVGYYDQYPGVVQRL